MKLQNKKTGEIVEDAYVRETHDFQVDGAKHVLAVFKSNGHSVPERISGPYNSLAELNAEWEDYEEPKERWYIDEYGKVWRMDIKTLRDGFDNKPLITFETKEEAKKAVEKLRAWKRLKDKGFKFEGWYYDIDRGSTNIQILARLKGKGLKNSDLDPLFGGEE